MTADKLMYRVGTGKLLGFLFGLAGFLLLPALVTQPELILRLAVLFWYTTLGAIIGVFGVFNRHPLFDWPFPWWLRGFALGAWMNLLLGLFAHQQMAEIVTAMLGGRAAEFTLLLIMLEGALIGLLMDYLLTRWFGDGVPA